MQATEVKTHKPKMIERFSARERLLHWLHFCAFVALVFTGFGLYAPFLQPLVQGDAGWAAKVVHRVAAIIFMAGPFLYLLINPRKLIENLKDMFTYTWRDVTWLLNAWGLYTVGDSGNMLPQGKFNAGQKMNTVLQVIGFVVFSVTGLIMWFGKGGVPHEVMQWAILFHDLMFIAMMTFFLVHLYLVAMNKTMRESLPAIFTGYVSEEFAQHHHGKWYEDVKKQELIKKAEKRMKIREREKEIRGMLDK